MQCKYIARILPYTKNKQSRQTVLEIQLSQLLNDSILICFKAVLTLNGQKQSGAVNC